MIAAALAACSGSGSGASTTASGDVTPEYGSYNNGPPLGPPPEPDPLKPGLEYLRVLERHIQPEWASFLEDVRLRLPPDHGLNDARLVAEIELALDSKGQIKSLEVRKSSGLEEFDQVATEVVRAGDPYGPPPELWLSDDNAVHVVWRFARDARQAGAGGAELVRVDLPLHEVVPRLIEAGDLAGAAQRVARAAGGKDRAELADLLRKVCIAVLRVALRGDDPDVAAEAARIAAAAGIETLSDDLRAVAFGDSGEKRPGPLRALGTLGATDAADDLVAMIGGAREASPEDAASAAFALAAMGQGASASEAIASALGGGEADRWRGLAAMTEVAAPRSVPSVQALLTGGGSRAIRIAAASALGPSAVAGKPARSALHRCLGDSDAALRAACADALAVAGERGLRDAATFAQLQKRLVDPDERALAAVVRAAGAVRPDRLPRIASRVDSSSPVVALALASALEDTDGTQATAVLLRLLDAQDPRTRRAAADALARRKDDRAREKALTLLDDGDAQVRASAAAAADQPEVLMPLLADPSPIVQAAALARLTELRGAPATAGDAAQRIASGRDAGARLPWISAWLGASQ